MKTAISLPDDLHTGALAAAERMQLTRSGLIARALESYLDSVEADVDPVTARLDEVHRRAGRRSASGAAAGRALIDAGGWDW